MLYVCCSSAWSGGAKGVNLHLGKSYFCHFCYWDAMYSIAFFHPYNLSCLFHKRKKKAKTEIYCIPCIETSNPTSHIFFFSFLSDWSIQKRKSSSSVQMMVRIFIDRFFNSCETFTPRNQTVAFSFVNILWEAARLESTTLWILSLQLLYAIHSELFCSSFKKVYRVFLTWGHVKTKK